MLKVAVNGFGRIGRNFLKASLGNRDFKVVAVNDLTDAHTLAHLFKYDSVYGRFDGKVMAGKDALSIDGNKIKTFSEKNPALLPWDKMGIDVVLESTGIFRKREQAEQHVKAGAKKVLLSAPPKGDKPVKQIVLGVNENSYSHKKDVILSNASCTTNCLAPVAKVLEDGFGISKGFMTTIHAYTSDQRILDAPHKDLRRARGAATSIIPTSTGAAKALGAVMPALKGRVTGSAMRVPVADGSIVDLVVELKKDSTVENINKSFKKASSSGLKGILQYCDEPIVSQDVIGNPHSAIFDSLLTNIEGDLVEVLAWYDNEWGYSNRLVDLIGFMKKKWKK